jgi:hypothetical protein
MTVQAAIPTAYRGLLFRSRLEAQWAHFFDGLSWPWEYEPFDLNGYIPDFVLKFKEPLLVEVKPELSIRELYKHTEKVKTSGWDKEALIVGATLFVGTEGPPEPCVGLLAERVEDPEYPNKRWWKWGEGLVFECLVCGLISLHHAVHSYRCRRNGCYDGNGHIAPVTSVDLLDLWFQAKNATQWSPKRQP